MKLLKFMLRPDPATGVFIGTLSALSAVIWLGISPPPMADQQSPWPAIAQSLITTEMLAAKTGSQGLNRPPVVELVGRSPCQVSAGDAHPNCLQEAAQPSDDVPLVIAPHQIVEPVLQIVQTPSTLKGGAGDPGQKVARTLASR